MSITTRRYFILGLAGTSIVVRTAKAAKLPQFSSRAPMPSGYKDLEYIRNAESQLVPLGRAHGFIMPADLELMRP